MDTERYSRQLILPGFGLEAQNRLLEAKVLVVGAGGLGCPALQYLAAAGIGNIGIIDDDLVSLSNLHRQILYATTDVGRLKVDAAKEKLAGINPEVSISNYPVKIDRNNAIEIIKQYDFIFDGSDNFATRYLVNDACALLKKPLVFAAVSGYEGQIAIFNLADDEHRTTNYRDIFPVEPMAGEILNCAETGVLGVLPGIIGTMAAAEIIKLITGIGTPLINKLSQYNLLTCEHYNMSITPGNDYNLPKTEHEFLVSNINNPEAILPSYIEIDAEMLKSLQEQPSTLVVDVRERHEFPKITDANIFQAPMSNFVSLLESDLPQKNIVFLCQHGIRSVAAAEAFHEKYGAEKNIFSLKGGIVKWRNHF